MRDRLKAYKQQSISALSQHRSLDFSAIRFEVGTNQPIYVDLDQDNLKNYAHEKQLKLFCKRHSKFKISNLFNQSHNLASMGDFQTLQNTGKNLRKHRHSKFLRNTMQSADYTGLYKSSESVFQQDGDLFRSDSPSNQLVRN